MIYWGHAKVDITLMICEETAKGNKLSTYDPLSSCGFLNGKVLKLQKYNYKLSQKEMLFSRTNLVGKTMCDI